MKRILIPIALMLIATSAQARFWTGAQDVQPDAGQTAGGAPGQAQKVKLQQKLGTQIPLDLKFMDEHGQEVTLGQYFAKGKPVLLTPVYFDCPMLCNMVLDGLVSGIRDLKFEAGKEYEIISFSFDPKDKPSDAAKKKDIFVKRYGRPGADQAWHFLTGTPEQIDALTEVIGFKYGYDERTGQYAHAAMTLVLTPEGRIARYFYGIEYRPRDLRLALVEASKDKIGSPVDQFLLLCYHYDPAVGKYSIAAMNAVRAGGAVTVAGLFGFIFIMVRREKRVALQGNKS